jgi:serine O-acetyltransferase
VTIDSSAHTLDAGDRPAQADLRSGQVPSWRDRLREDVQTIHTKDPAARSLFEVLTCYPGLHAIWLHRLAHGLWRRHRLILARLVSHLNRFLTGIEIHPGARIGRRFFVDHGAGVVIGETAVIGDDVLMYTGVILGGTTSEHAKRHPTIGHGVVLGSHAILLGNITIGDEAKVGSGSVVVASVPPGATVVGVPGRVVRMNGQKLAQRMPDVLDHGSLPDPVVETLRCLLERVEYLEGRVRDLAGTSARDWPIEVPIDCAPLASTSLKDKGEENQ